MKVVDTAIPGVLILEPRMFGDGRGFFFESYNEREFLKAAGIGEHFVQDNHSRSERNVLRGLHYQVRQTQGKLVRVIAGEIFDVVVDLRKSSPTFRRWVSVPLSADNKRMLWVPKGFAHGFLTLSDTAECLYKASDYYAPEFERTIIWNDQELAIEWPLGRAPVLSAKDSAGVALSRAELFP